MTTTLSVIDNLIRQMDCDEQESKNNVNIPTTKHFYKTYDRLVFDAIDGELYSNPNLSRLYTSDASIKVVYRSDWDKSKVALISGGGSGHEPCFFGFIGKGMLTAAVCGEIFSSPTTKAIIHAILKVGSKDKGVLLIVTNYTGDVFNFTLAAEICINKYNIPCKILSLCDDISLPRSNIPNIGRRGLAGGVFIHKMAGYYSEIGKDLNEIHSICSEYSSYIGTVGIAASVCHLIGTKSNLEMIDSELELGYGVHGEPGFEKIKFDNIENIIPKMMQLFNDFSQNRNYLKFMETHNNNNNNSDVLRIVIMLNNLGGITNIEMCIIKKYLIEYIYNGNLGENIQIERIFCGKFETSLDMKGFSISIMKVNDNILTALDYNINIKSWNKGEIFQINALEKSKKISEEEEKENIINIFEQEEEEDEKGNELSDEGANILKLCIESGCKSIIKNKNILNELDNICGDGDCGTTLEFGAKLLLKNIINNNKFNNYKSLKYTLQKIGYLLSDMGGSSGALYGYLFICASNQISSIEIIDSINICNAFKNSIFELSKYSKAKQNDRTMLDSLIPAIEKIIETYSKDKNDHQNGIKQCSIAANNGCNNTQNMIAKFGRSSYLSSKVQEKCVDPGAKAVAIWIDSFVDVICNNNNFVK